MLLLNKNLGKLTKHEYIGMDERGRSIYKCCETGDVRTVSSTKTSKARIEKMKQDRAKRDEALGDLNPTRGVSDENVQRLRDFLNNKE